METKVVHSQSKDAWNIIGELIGHDYKIARFPYLTVPDSDILTTRNKANALERAMFVSKCLKDYKD